MVNGAMFFNDIKDLHLSSLATLVPEEQEDLDMCFMQHRVKFTEVCHLMCFLF